MNHSYSRLFNEQNEREESTREENKQENTRIKRKYKDKRIPRKPISPLSSSDDSSDSSFSTDSTDYESDARRLTGKRKLQPPNKKACISRAMESLDELIENEKLMKEEKNKKVLNKKRIKKLRRFNENQVRKINQVLIKLDLPYKLYKDIPLIPTVMTVPKIHGEPFISPSAGYERK